MKKILLLTFSFFITMCFCFGKTRVAGDTLSLNHKYLNIVTFDDHKPVCTENEFIDPAKIASGDLMPDSSSKEICRLLKVDAVIIYRLKPGTKLLTLNDVFNLYKIKSDNRKLPVQVDEKAIDYPETILISENQIQSVKVKNGRLISIILMGYYETLKKYKGGPFKE